MSHLSSSTSSDPSIATVVGDRVNGIAPGTATISAANGAAQIDVTVSGAAPMVASLVPRAHEHDGQCDARAVLHQRS